MGGLFIIISGWQFQYPWFLTLLLLIPLWGYISYRYRRSLPTLRLSLGAGFKTANNFRLWTLRLGWFFRYTAFVFLIAALARPIQPLAEEQIETEAISIALVMDISSSMLARDFEPNRLEAAKAVAMEFIEKRKDDLFALIPFAGESFTSVPLTHDHLMVQQQLKQLSCGWIEDGTAIGMGLGNALNRLKDAGTASKIVVLLTDGVNNAGYLNPVTAAEIAASLGIKIYAIGIGTEGEALSPIGRRADGQYVFGYARVEIDETLLQQVAAQTGGQYFRADNLEKLVKVYDAIDKLEKSKVKTAFILREREWYPWFIGLAITCLLLDVLLTTFWIKRSF
jgi:Ca-activated chloride channel homolog